MYKSRGLLKGTEIVPNPWWLGSPFFSPPRFLQWDRNDGEYFLKKVRGRKVMEMEDENMSTAQMIESFVESAPLKVRYGGGGKCFTCFFLLVQYVMCIRTYVCGAIKRNTFTRLASYILQVRTIAIGKEVVSH